MSQQLSYGLEHYLHLTKDEIKFSVTQLLKKFDINNSLTHVINEDVSAILKEKLCPYTQAEMLKMATICVYNENVPALQLLLSIPHDIKYGISIFMNIHDDNDTLFKIACDEHAYCENNVIHFLIFDHHITFTETIAQYIINFPDIQKLFQKRELNKTLHNELLLENKSKPNKLKL